MSYNHIYTRSGVCMPLLMGCTFPEPLNHEECLDVKLLYNPTTQRSGLDLRYLGTRCLKVSTTRKKNPNSSNGKGFIGVTDRKNEIDDQKWVK